MLKNSVMAGALIQAQEGISNEYPVISPRRGFTAQEIQIATMSLMTGPKAQRPSWRAIRKTILRLRRGRDTKGGWRSWPHEGERI